MAEIPITKLPYIEPSEDEGLGFDRHQFTRRARITNLDTSDFMRQDRMFGFSISSHDRKPRDPFAINESALRLLIAQRVWNYIGRAASRDNIVPAFYADDLDALKKLAEKSRFPSRRKHAEAVARLGGYVQMTSIIAYLKFRMLYLNIEIAEELDLPVRVVMSNVTQLRLCAQKLGLDLGKTRMKPRRPVLIRGGKLGGTGSPWTPEKLEQLRTLRAKGLSWSKIGRALGLAADTVRRGADEFFPGEFPKGKKVNSLQRDKSGKFSASS